jgi:hypothetical protein
MALMFQSQQQMVAAECGLSLIIDVSPPNGSEFTDETSSGKFQPLVHAHPL